MTTIHMGPSYEAPRPHSQSGLHSSPIESPRIQRPLSQMSLHLAPVSNSNFSPILPHDHSMTPITAYNHGAHAQPFKPLTPSNVSFQSSYPNTAPPMPYYPPYDHRHASQPMIRTVSHAHPMHSATEQTASSRYSNSPPSASGMFQQSPPSASFQSSYQMPQLQPTIHFTEAEERQHNQQQQNHINPSLFNPNNNNNAGYPMSRSTSGASVSDAGNDMGRLLTPHYEYRDHLSPQIGHGGHDDLRKVSDPLSFNMQGRHRLYPSSLAPNYSMHEHGLGLGPHPQPHGGDVYFKGNGFAGDHFALSSERSEQKATVGLGVMGIDTDYEREREAQIMNNRKLLEDVGLAGNGMFRNRELSGAQRNRKQTPVKKRLLHEQPARISPRIASRGSISYHDLEGGERISSGSEESYASEPDYDEEDDFRPAKRSKGRGVYGRKSYAPSKSSRKGKVDLSLWGLLQPYPEIPHLFPLFYYTLNNDLSINPDSVPLIGSIPSTCTPLEKAETLRAFFHRGRRVLAQLDSFTSRCDRKYEGPDEKWVEMDYHTRISIRDVRRKVVERCENYKYTRRDILDKVLGKNKWQNIEIGMISWDPTSGNNDPANDLANVTLTLPTPPPSAYHTQQQHQSHNSNSSGRTIKPFPSRSRISSQISPDPNSARIQSVNMSMGMPTPLPVQMPISGTTPMIPMSSISPNPDYSNHSSTSFQTNSTLPTPLPYSASVFSTPLPPAHSTAALPMYGEDEVPMSVQMPGQNQNQGHNHTVPIAAPATAAPVIVSTQEVKGQMNGQGSSPVGSWTESEGFNA